MIVMYIGPEPVSYSSMFVKFIQIGEVMYTSDRPVGTYSAHLL